ncbi:MAG: hypothetical protein IJN42_03365 [Clostridia bacterium]|nr:hypothetical protein [Clostridia bacterium]
MVYTAVFFALFFNAAKGYSGKKVSILAKHTEDAYLFSTVRMALCMLIGFVLMLFDGGSLQVEGGMLAIGLLSGIANVAFMIGWMLAVQHNALVTVDVSLTLGSIIPAVLCAMLFAEPIKLPKMFGFALIVIASFILSKFNKTGKKKTFGGICWLIMALLGDGMISFSQQLYTKFYQEGGAFAGEAVYPMSVYHFYSFLFSFIVLLVVLVILLCKKPSIYRREYCQKIGSTLRPAWIHVGIMAGFLFGTNFFQTLATGTLGMPSQVLYPIIKGGSLIINSVTAMIFFKEKLTLRGIFGIIIALGGIILLNVL